MIHLSQGVAAVLPATGPRDFPPNRTQCESEMTFSRVTEIFEAA